MPASLLYHTNQIDDVQIINVEYHIDRVIFKMIFVPKQPHCPCCDYKENISKGAKQRKLRMAPLGNKMSFLFVNLHRLQFTNCKHVWWPVMPFVRGKKRLTLSFEKYVIELMEFATIEHKDRRNYSCSRGEKHGKCYIFFLRVKRACCAA